MLPLKGFISTRSEGDFIILGLLGLEPAGGIPNKDALFPDFFGYSSAETNCFVTKFKGWSPLSLALVDDGWFLGAVTSPYVPIVRPLLKGWSSFYF